MRGPASASDHYWYEDDAARARTVDVLEALRAYRAAEAAMRRRTREAMGMGENDLLALRYLLRSQGQGVAVSPKDLARYLGISSASTTVLIDRLEKSGHVARRPSPSDRRALIIVPTGASDAEVRATLGEMHSRMFEVAKGLDADQANAVTVFLTAMREAVDQIDAHPEIVPPALAE